MDEKIPLEEFIKQEKVTYTKINFVRADIENFKNEIQGGKEELNNYKKMRNLDHSQYKVDFFAEMCETNVKNIDFYNINEDTTLGQYIILKVQNLEAPCLTCKQPRYNHVSIYYFTDVYLRISVDKKFVLK